MGCGASKVARGAVARAARTIGGQPGINNRDHRGVGYREIWIVSGEPSEGSIRRFRRVPQMGGVGGLDVQRPGFFEGQRPGIIPAYGTTIGIGRRNGERAEGPGTFRGFVAGNDGSGLQPLDLSFAVPDLGLHPRLVWFAPLVLGKGRTANGRRWTPMREGGRGELIIKN